MADIVYTVEDFRSATRRPKIHSKGQAVRFRPAIRRHTHSGETCYVFASPCCGERTLIELSDLEWSYRGGREVWFFCGKPYNHRRGRPRPGGCRACYDIKPAGTDAAGNALFDLSWRGY